MKRIVNIACCIFSLSLAVAGTVYGSGDRSPIKKNQKTQGKKAATASSTSTIPSTIWSVNLYAKESFPQINDAPYIKLILWTTDWVAVMPKYGQSVTLDADDHRQIDIYCQANDGKTFRPKKLNFTCTSGAMNCELVGEADAFVRIVCKNTNSSKDERLNIQIAECDKNLDFFSTATILEEKGKYCGVGSYDVLGNPYPS